VLSTSQALLAAIGFWDHYHAENSDWGLTCGWSVYGALALATQRIRLAPMVLLARGILAGGALNEPSAHWTLRVRVRHYEMDALGHVNNAVYLHYVEEAAIEHARQLGFDEARWRELGGAWVVRRHEIDYRVAAVAGDELDVTTRIVALDRVSGTRRTTIVRVADGGLVVQALTHWVWVGLDGRPRRLPAEVIAALPSPAPEAKPDLF
jgi:acyl-CoA thioester hydrolase